MSRNQARALLAARLEAVPDALQQTLSVADAEAAGDGDAETLERPDLAWVRAYASPAELGRPVVTTGIGASEGPARVLAWLLAHVVGLAAGFRPLSQLVAEAPRREDAILVVFSQGLSPNAQLALAQGPRFHRLLVYTSLEPSSDEPLGRLALERAAEHGALIARLPPRSEPGLFLRVLGPAAATLAAVQLTAVWAEQRGAAPGWPLMQLPLAAARALSEAHGRCAAFAGSLVERRLVSADAVRSHGLGALFAALPELPIAMLTTAGYGELCHGLRWQLLEGAGLREPMVWDALGFVHGPLQQIYNRPALLIALRRPDEAVAPLWPRLRHVLRPHHMLLELPASLPAPLSLLEHQMQIGALVREALRDLDWDLSCWPGQGRDRALYGVSDPAELSERAIPIPYLPEDDPDVGYEGG